MDETIIDVNTQNLDLSVEKSEVNNSSTQEPPYWEHNYIYSYDEIKYATKAQKQFYAYFKNQVANGNYVDIQGNTNYAFILYFDFLNEYQNHRDIKLLDEQFKLLGEICPKTIRYSLRYLQDEFKKRSDPYSVDKLKDLEEQNYPFEHGYSGYNFRSYKLGNQYKGKLGLNKQEITWLNKFYFHKNSFFEDQESIIAVIDFYLLIVKELDDSFKKKNSSLDFQIKHIIKHKGENSYEQWEEKNIYLGMFNRVQSLIRFEYGFDIKNQQEKIFHGYGDDRVSVLCRKILQEKIENIIAGCKGKIRKPTLDTEIHVNSRRVNRWKNEFNILKNRFKVEEKEKFIHSITSLEEKNQKNPNIENIFFESSRFMAKYDKVQSLKYYAKYIYYDLKSGRFKNRQLAKTIQKLLFKTKQQTIDFKNIIVDLICMEDIQTALEDIPKIYIPKRKQIQLDRSKIKEVEQKYEGTVELLNEYLDDGKEKMEMDDKTEEDVKIAIIPSEENNSIFISEIKMRQTQEELVKMIINNSFMIHQDEVDKYAMANGMFKNQLIDSINEACEKHLDGEALIEEDGENYVIEESYYKEIAK